MTRRQGAAVLRILGLTSIGLNVPWTVDAADNAGDKRCRLEGEFILKGTGGVHVLDMAVPLDPAGDRVALNHDLADYDVTLGGLLPTAVRYSTAQGEAIRTGPRSFDYTLHFWGLDSANRRVSLVLSSGTKLFREGDCNTYDTVGGTLSVYLASQDADGDGVPDIGKVPIACVPVALTARRMSIVPPCTPKTGANASGPDSKVELAGEVAECKRILKSGTVSWGGGTAWESGNIDLLCSGTKNARETIACFQSKVASLGWAEAISQCK